MALLATLARLALQLGMATQLSCKSANPVAGACLTHVLHPPTACVVALRSVRALVTWQI